ncbi:MAG TPA: hypothetical protein VHZ07_14420 [Bryobacteraceae bacterium]|jgi:hypothetical protein|nr:hypothetical protein [Bryobacteraceae bacterium]
MLNQSRISPEELLSYFGVGGSYPNVYVLGCFARYVTLYSQQARALNLIWALLERKILKSGSNLTIVGAGAAGLTASLAAALADVKVTLLEELEGPLQLQTNNRQRWLHPRIYDWPSYDFSNDDDQAHLPLLDWRAGYAESVADQIREVWEKKVEANRERIRAIYHVSGVEISPNAGGVKWNEPKRAGLEIDDAIIILAIGFGLDGDRTGRGCYWLDDDLDNSLKPLTDLKILIVGHGDGALTDAMRLCFRRFRHSKIINLFPRDESIKGIKHDLLDIQGMKPDPGESPALFARRVHRRFRDLETRGLGHSIEPLIRSNRPVVHLTGRDGNFYSHGSSVLNRLILRFLIEQGIVRPVPGPAELNPERIATLEHPGGMLRLKVGTKQELYDRVVYRTGPEPAAVKRFPDIEEACAKLRSKWEQLNLFTDPTRQEHSWDFYRELTLAKPKAMPPVAFVPDLGYRAASMSVVKEIRRDGSSSVIFAIRDLIIERGQIEGVWFLIQFSAGAVGAPELDAAARQIGATWVPDRDTTPEPETLTERMDFVRKKARRVCGTLRFRPALDRLSPPASFGLKFIILNGDALSSWEFEQLYTEDDRKHVNDREPIENLEYFARTVLLPLDTLQLTLTVPEQINAPPFMSVFECSNPDGITRDTVAPNNVLQLNPSRDSPLHFDNVVWRRASPETVKAVKLTNQSSRTWEAVVERPPVGAVYSMDFRVPSVELDGEVKTLVNEAQDFRNKLLHYARLRRTGAPLDYRAVQVRREVLSIYEALAYWYALSPDVEEFQVSVMTYDESQKRLITIDGTINGGEPSSTAWDFWLPFGLGIGGACFKRADRPFVYVRPKEGAMQTGPDIYIPPPLGTHGHEVLVSIPVNHPDYTGQIEMERSRQCIAVVTFGSDNPSTKLHELSGQDEETMKRLMGYCQYFGDRLFEIMYEGNERH